MFSLTSAPLSFIDRFFTTFLSAGSKAGMTAGTASPPVTAPAIEKSVSTPSADIPDFIVRGRHIDLVV
ncbi:hypothetical protein NCH01_18890 [Neoasaia chiangmaiensis]|nr:hypothetical protein [Neoasaia chiangmaiensis]GEN15458.1 hypothetical protein NCH01_18890 [Neoasaia chiangmaiensis]